MELRTANVVRYIMPLREGGSLPALAEADDEYKYVVKFRGAGHGTKALIAELIDHGASLYFHYSWSNWRKHALSPFIQIKDHALLPEAGKLEETDAEFKRILTPDKIREIVSLVPDDWLLWNESPGTPQEIRDVYIEFLTERIAHSETLIKEAQHARKALI